MKCGLIPVVFLAAVTSTARGDLSLFARYDWQEGARDVSGSPLRHDGQPDNGTLIHDGRLWVDGWTGVYLGQLPELDGATSVLFRFDDVTFTRHSQEGNGATSNFTVLTGDSMNWWAAVHFELPPYGNRTLLSFSLAGFGEGPRLEAVVADDVVDHFDSIEYRFDATAPAGQKLAVRWNDGPWVTGGESEQGLHAFPRSTDVRINNGGPADWDPMWGSFGPVSYYSNQVPEPAAAGLLLASAALAFFRRGMR